MLSTLALYLPQFHRIPENDKWWGEGFTEWTAVKGAKALFEGHKQPRVPLNHNYYELLDHDTMVWQAELMQRYRIDGMCIYHYWFEGGKRILEKPAENLLKWNDVQMPFCFCWANETWSRTWKKITGANPWSSIYETKDDIKDNGVLLRQRYGREKDWEEHFQYLLSFFADNRYIKLNGMPVFAIYKPSDIFSLGSMMDYFNNKAMEHGFPGIYVIGMEDNKTVGLDATCVLQPRHAVMEYFEFHNLLPQSLMKYSYDKLWEVILKHKRKDEKTYLCGFVDFDSSPRMGESGGIIEDASPEKFYIYYKKLYRRSLELKNEFVFVNAWNEWGESMYLEPDEENGYGYLEMLKRVIVESEKVYFPERVGLNEECFEMESESENRRMKSCMDILRRHDALLDQWLYLRDMHIDLGVYFKKYGYHQVAIYGMGKLGTHLLYELIECGINVPFGIDKNIKDCMVEVYLPEQQMPKVDAVVITVIDKYGEIGRILSKKMECPMIAIEEVIQELTPD